ncbi:MAG: AMMECR1 domain-containing protein, partial [Candidatus Melainabacteria bacterium]|nr:AMMECR1 domain-containing protein [Candidatus Melainabacteria bacterium]
MLYYGSFLLSSPKYEVYALRAGVANNLKKSSFIQNAKGKIDIAWVYWLIKKGNTIVLVDSGFTGKQDIKRWRVKKYVRPDILLSQIGIAPEFVSDIILTNGHWDRAGGIHLFPNAKVWIQKGEYMDGGYFSKQSNKKSYRKDIQSYLDKLNKEGRLKLLNGSSIVKKGIKCELVGTHTNHSQAVVVNSVNGKIVLAGSEVYFYENLDKDIPIHPAVFPEKNKQWMKKAVKLVSRKEFVVPSYDPKVFEVFDTVSSGIVKITKETNVAKDGNKKALIKTKDPGLVKGQGNDLLNETEELNLVKFARSALSQYSIDQNASIKIPSELKNIEKYSNQVFVTLRNNGELLGCQSSKGNNLPVNLLRALKSAMNDKRFKSYNPSEFNNVTIEVFVLLDEIEISDKSYRNVERSVDIGRDSIRVQRGNKGATFVNDVPITHNWSFEYAIYKLLKKARLITKEQEADDRSKQKKLVEEMLQDPELKFYKIPTIQLLESQDQSRVIELYRGNVLVGVDEVSEKSLMESLKLSAKWLLNAMNEDGSKVYLWQPSENKFLRSGNLVRQLATTGVMGDLAELLQNNKLREATKANLAYHLSKDYVEDKSNGIGYISEDAKEITVNIGTAAFAIMAILKSGEDKKYASQLQHLIKFILTRQKEDGSFDVYYPSGSVDPKRAYKSQRYYAGEALLALMYLYEKTKDNKYLEVVEKAFPYYRDFYRKDKNASSIPWLT